MVACSDRKSEGDVSSCGRRKLALRGGLLFLLAFGAFWLLILDFSLQQHDMREIQGVLIQREAERGGTSTIYLWAAHDFYEDGRNFFAAKSRDFPLGHVKDKLLGNCTVPF
jgi:hypothetical protein